ncbi:hypothetical protein EJ04DRAFT_548379 [Polyplosphaeria fusca]|uniref:F-box domain-containing protein n=1 Tax=Polyplosphaeria fusca TaxID=682080 RepID=A0A9P4R7G7_9PLEO|nr:hypothetical protein EJ04DRAFT_548379 [Polyplosphaeria fusca]
MQSGTPAKDVLVKEGTARALSRLLQHLRLTRVRDVKATGPTTISTLLQRPKIEHATFLTLPGELRNQIYRHVLFPYTMVLFIVKLSCRDLARSIFKPGVFRVSRQIRQESRSLLLSTKEFRFFNAPDMASFLASIGLEGREQIGNIALVLCESRLVQDKWYSLSEALNTDLFARYLADTSSLKRFHLSLQPKVALKFAKGDDDFVTTMKRAVEAGGKLKMTWCTITMDTEDEHCVEELVGILGAENREGGDCRPCPHD